MQNRLLVVLFIVIATVFMGVGVIVALNTGHGTGKPILLAALAGAVLALPVSWLVTQKIARVIKT